MTRRWRLLAPGVTLGGVAAALVLHPRDPHRHGSWGACPSVALGGLAVLFAVLRDVPAGAWPSALSAVPPDRPDVRVEDPRDRLSAGGTASAATRTTP